MTAEGATETKAFCILLSFEGIEPERYLDRIMPIVSRIPNWWKVSSDERAFVDKLIRWTSATTLDGGTSVLFWSEQVIAPEKIPLYEKLLSAMADKLRGKSFCLQAVNDDGKEVTATFSQALGGLETTVFNALYDLPGIEKLLAATAQRAEDSAEPGHEVRELQDVLREAWRLLNQDQRAELARGKALAKVMDASQLTSTNHPGANQVQKRHDFETILNRWDLGSGSETPMANEPSYRAKFESVKNHIWLDVSPVSSNAENPLGPSLQIAIEINNGLPCAHIHTNGTEELHLSIFGATDGKIHVRPAAWDGLDMKRDFSPPVEEVDDFFGKVSENNAQAESSPQP